MGAGTAAEPVGAVVALARRCVLISPGPKWISCSPTRPLVGCDLRIRKSACCSRLTAIWSVVTVTDNDFGQFHTVGAVSVALATRTTTSNDARRKHDENTHLADRRSEEHTSELQSR